MSESTRAAPKVRILADHKRFKKVLIPPLFETAQSLGSFERDGLLPEATWADKFLPEFLWLGNIALSGDSGDIARRFNRACDLLDVFVPLRNRARPFVGYISDFALIGVRRRKAALATVLADHPDYLGLDVDFRCAISTYEGCPASWLAEGLEEVDQRVERGEVRLRSIVVLLKDLESDRVLRSRIVGLNRLFTHRKLFFDSNGIDAALVDAMAAYPDCGAADKSRVEQMCRIISNLDFRWREYEEWNKRFWSINSQRWRCDT